MSGCARLHRPACARSAAALRGEAKQVPGLARMAERAFIARPWVLEFELSGTARSALYLTTEAAWAWPLN